ncbi:erythromycin esterase family protein [Williamsia sterculiae]|uniref:Erythromycin esterase homolog n=1 Tax=Williamsia sterculiae TaxID=1344003 RepID=A0A1N7H1T2_9NOCA|nr:erythromycin esterase family protein [Williamsia sterculiae]SIS18783.1 Erythromycin esterase homolog [Williamsia sterculiae]
MSTPWEDAAIRDGLLDDLCSDATVVGWSEGPHRTSEFLDARNIAFRALVQNHGVEVLAAETGFTDGLVTQRYLDDDAAVTLSEATHCMWIWNDRPLTQNRDLLEWMYAHNRRRPADAVRFVGIDMCGGRFGRFARAHIGLGQALAVAARISPRALGARTEVAPLLPLFTADDYRRLTGRQADTITAVITELTEVLASLDPHDPDVAIALRQCAIAAHHDANFRHDPTTWSMGIRDAAQFENLRWTLNRLCAPRKVMVFEQVSHLEPHNPVSLGHAIRAAHGDRAVLVAAAWGDGTDSRASRDTARLSSAVARWLPASENGPILIDLRRDSPLRPHAAGFDAVLYVRQPTSASPL